ncbi:hypothetical protein EWM64_g5671 [Hericium alpestre]|uniref:LysM domain-containing protein n=1 Tax=Hericium alpestre TaxID=135208 RepID=A0A4Y9ZWA7_9AGAM|nr:hypothetical protein EWM64_g5671 [Hericium alpestre]
MFARTAVSAIVAAAFASSALAASCARTYTVQASEYCDAISAAQNVSTYQLAVVNPQINQGCTNLLPGQSLCLGNTGEDCQTTYKVVSGNTCDDLTKQFNINSTILYANNPQINADCSNLYVNEHAHFLELGVIRTFEFVSQLRRMSVIVKRLKSNSMEVYTKGAPEVMTDICEKDSFPDDYDDLLSYYTKRGYRVIAIAGKSIEGLSWLKAQRMKREQAESGLQFLGLVIFENKLKPGTAPAIAALRAAHLPCRMITGDNPLTAVSVARECNLITQTAHVFAPTFKRGNPSTPLSKIEWNCMDDPEWELDDYSLKPLTPPSHHGIEADMLDYQDYALAVTGDVFRWMINHAALETLQRMLARAQIFARMSPDEKNEVVERLQALGYTVLIEAEASVAAPFTSKTPDISCVLEVIREGRAALVTSFSCFKYMALYSLIQFTTITLLYSFASSLGDFQFLYIDLFIIIPVAVTMGRTLPFPRIHPKRPTASLVSTPVLASIIGQIVLTSAVQFWAFFWIRRQPWVADALSDRALAVQHRRAARAAAPALGDLGADANSNVRAIDVAVCGGGERGGVDGV